MSTISTGMTSPGVKEQASASPRSGDSLAASVIFLVALSCIQPIVALLRGMAFCRWLEPDELGCWDMALAFMTLAAPLVVFGVPGSLGRYVEPFSQRGQLRMFLRRTVMFTAVLGIVASIGVALGSGFFSWVVFNRSDLSGLVPLVALGLATMILFGFVTELLTAMRMFRVVSGLQLLKGVAFALVGVGLLLCWNRGPDSVLIGHVLGSLVAAVVGLFWVWPAWRGAAHPAAESTTLFSEPQVSSADEGTRGFWMRLLPFAMWVWVTNILTNLFEIVDRLMIIHYGTMTPNQALQAVGQYHSSRIVPLLMVSFAAMLSSLVLPHLVRDWEGAEHARVRLRLNLALKGLGLALFAGSAVVLAAAPYLFRVLLQGKYDGGLEVLPWTLAYCSWFGLSFVAGTYLWCAERVRLGSTALAVGLACNVMLNLALLPPLGLLGAVLATAAAKLVVMLLVMYLGWLLGMKFDLGTWLLVLAPMVLPLGSVASMAILAVAGLALVGTDRLLSAEEKQLLGETLGRFLRARNGRGTH